ncbi:MAG TPA: double-strand break repair protein AddB, partial [Alphaproteobacteria bacterium]|nr:double-strand break repair protein AddB [Alphaproteobacteria bacterium]
MAAGRTTVYSIPPGEAFVDALARGLIERHGGDPLTFSRMLVLLPTRRAVRALREAFLRQQEGQALLLPAMRPIGDVDTDELLIETGPAGTALELPPAIGGLRRVLLLGEAIRRRDAAAAGEAVSPAQAALLARELAQLLDQLQTEDVPLAALDALVPEDYAEHWQKTLRFLQVLREPWQAILAAEGAVDPVTRRNALLRAQAARWQEAPPDHPVIAAGSTGSIPATAELLRVVARLPQGAVVLPGLDTEADEETWGNLDPAHPQYGLSHLLQHMGVARAEVGRWPGAAEAAPR